MGHLTKPLPSDFFLWGSLVENQSPGTMAKLEIAARFLGPSVHTQFVRRPVNTMDKRCRGLR